MLCALRQALGQYTRHICTVCFGACLGCQEFVVLEDLNCSKVVLGTYRYVPGVYGSRVLRDEVALVERSTSFAQLYKPQ